MSTALPQAPAAKPRRSLPLGLAAFEAAITRAGYLASGACLVIAAGSAALQVVMRFVFHLPLDWSEPLTRMLLIWMVFLGLPYAIRMGALVSIDLALAKSKGAWRSAIRAAIVVAELALLGALAWYGTLMAIRVSEQVFAGLEVSIAWAYGIVPVGAVLSVPAVLAHWVDHRSTELDAAQ